MTSESLAVAVARVEEAQRVLAEAMAARDALIRELLPSEGATRLSRATGLARGRIYQIAGRSS